jgi:hypothetical protein
MLLKRFKKQVILTTTVIPKSERIKTVEADIESCIAQKKK